MFYLYTTVVYIDKVGKVKDGWLSDATGVVDPFRANCSQSRLGDNRLKFQVVSLQECGPKDGLLGRVQFSVCCWSTMKLIDVNNNTNNTDKKREKKRVFPAKHNPCIPKKKNTLRKMEIFYSVL